MAGLLGRAGVEGSLCQGATGVILHAGVINRTQLWAGRMRGRVLRAPDRPAARGLKSFYLRPAYMIGFPLATRSVSDLYRKIRGAGNFFSYLCTEHRRR